MDSLTVIPALYVLKDCPPDFSETLICVGMDIFLFYYGMEGFYAGIIIGISFTVEWMECPMATQVPFTSMSFQNVKTCFEGVGPADYITAHSQTDDTVGHAAEAVGCGSAETAKSLTFLADGKPATIVMAGGTRANSSKLKVCFYQKPSMVFYEQIGELIGHQSGVLI